MTDKFLTIQIPYAIATDVIHVLNRNGYVLFARPDRSIMITDCGDASAHELVRRAGNLYDSIRTAFHQHDANRSIFELVGLYVESCERFGPEQWVSRSIAGLLRDTRNDCGSTAQQAN